MEEDNNLENTENLEEQHQQVAPNVPDVKKIAGNGYKAVGNTMKTAGTGMEYGGKAAKYAGKGIDNVGKGISKLGDAAKAIPYVGALLGGGLKLAGGATRAFGKGTEAAGKAAEKTGEATKKAGDATKTTGKTLGDSKILAGNDDGSSFIKYLKFILPITGVFGLMFFGVIFFVIIWTFFDFESEASGGSGSYDGIVFEDDCNFENTMVTVMDVTNTKVLSTVSLEDYIIGVAVYEIGAYGGNYASLPEHYVKAQYIAAKTWLLSSKGYNSSTKKLTVRASTADQQWCDLEKGCYDVDYGKGLIGSFPGGYDGKAAARILTAQDLETARRYYRELYGQLYLPPKFNSTITTLGSTKETATYYVSTTQNLWRTLANEGKTYEEILKATGATAGGAGFNNGLSNPDISVYYSNKEIYHLGNYCKSTSSTVSSNIDYVNWMIEFAADDSHGYSMNSRTMNPDVDCSSFVYYALLNNGYTKEQLGGYPFNTSGMPSILSNLGFEQIDFDKGTLQPGDILWYPASYNGHEYGHTEVYVGDGKSVGAHSNYDGKTGDGNGKEVSVVNVATYKSVFRKKS